MHFLVVLIISLAVAAFAFFGSGNINKPEAPADGVYSPQPVISASPSPVLKSKVLFDVPFVSQAPTGNWDDPRQQDGCEEAAAYMVMLWVMGSEAPKTQIEQEKKIVEIADWEEEEYGNYHDTAVEDTVERVYRQYFKYEKVKVVKDVTVEKIKQELSSGNLVQVPADGRALGNPNYTAPGPERHNLLIIGYDEANGEFITNDNGTRKGKGYRYKYEVMMSAIRDYPTGYHEPITGKHKAMIVISK
ncbi:MAG: Uncharacterized protein G01um10145_521 [Microgenomates group bacterium Gr01-1014_5]|nr:MAG: Uncharacterized protein G01um10145_521 [Microgenomates group bacterium Gr01-1014_5]